MQFVMRPLGPWVEGDTKNRRSRYTFKAPWSDTLALLDSELRHLNARQIVLQADFRERDLRLDGMPRADARVPQHPGVRIAFESIHGPLTYATDSCAFWQHNFRSIALGLEALRAVDRYGVTKRGEQYRGWSQLPPGTVGTGATPMGQGMSKEQAIRLIAEHAGVDFIASTDLADPTRMRRLWRQARGNVHPDRTGDSALFLRLEAAAFVLGIDA